jgi:hypothetical protein
MGFASHLQKDKVTREEKKTSHGQWATNDEISSF